MLPRLRKRLAACCGSGTRIDYSKKYEKFLDGLRFETKQRKALIHMWRTVIDKKDTDGVIARDVLHSLFLPTAPFFQYLLGVFDTTRDGLLDFCEFTSALFAIAAPTRQNLIRLAFDLYDFDHDGKLTAKEVVSMVTELVGRDWEVKIPRLVPIVKHIDKALRCKKLTDDDDGSDDDDLEVPAAAYKAVAATAGDDFEEAKLAADAQLPPGTRQIDGAPLYTFAHFIMFVRTNPVVMLPLFALQDQLRSRALTLSYWCGDGEKLWKTLRSETGGNVEAFAHLIAGREPVSQEVLDSFGFGELHDASPAGSPQSGKGKYKKSAVEKNRLKPADKDTGLTSQQRRYMAVTSPKLLSALTAKERKGTFRGSPIRVAAASLPSFDDVDATAIIRSTTNKQRKAELPKGMLAPNRAEGAASIRQEVSDRLQLKMRGGPTSPTAPQAPAQRRFLAIDLATPTPALVL